MRQLYRFIGGLLAIALFTGALGGCGNSVSGAGADTPAAAENKSDYVMNIITYPTLCGAGLHIAHVNGYFADEGLNYEWIMGDGSEFDLMVTGKNDVIYALVPTLIQRVANGMEMDLVMSAHKGCIQIVVPEDSDIQTVEDLEGKVVGVPGIGSDPAIMLQRVLKNYGLDTSPEKMDVELAAFNDTDLSMAMEQGQVDAISCWDPVAETIAQSGGRVIFNQTTADGYADEYCCVVALRPGFVDEHPEEAAAFGRALQKACDFISENPEEAAKIQFEAGLCANEDLEMNARLLGSYNFKGELEEARNSIATVTRDLMDLNIIDIDITADEFADNMFRTIPGLEEPA